MTIIILVRHGENDYVKEGRLAGRLPGVHLNKHGKKQANALARYFKSSDIKAVYSSPLERTMETAVPIAAQKGLDVIPRKGLIEIDFGKWENEKIKDLSDLKLWLIVQNIPSRMQFPGGETFQQAQSRVVNELNKLARKYKEHEEIVCVSHSDTIKLAVAYYIGLPLDFFQRLNIAPASISILKISDTNNRLLTLNYELSIDLP